MNQKIKGVFARCYYSFFVSGMSVLVIGAILPLLIEESGISFTVAGGLLSAMAIGNLLSSFVVPIMYQIFGRRIAIGLMASLVPVSFVGLTFMPPVLFLYILMLLIGIGRGAMSNFNNAVVSDNSGGKPAALNLLHTCFALGAFLSPFMTSVLIRRGFGWRHIIYILVALCITSIVGLITISLDEGKPLKKEAGQTCSNSSGYLKNFHFYCVGLILFFYLGMENCVNGWFVTYLKNTNIMSTSYATTMVSVMWLVIMAGRLLCAYLSKTVPKKTLIIVNCIGSMAGFLLLISTNNLNIITVALMILAFFLAGIYPTSVSDVSSLISGSVSGMAVLMGISALGGIITPQIIGFIADKIGLVAAISFLAFDVAAMVVFAFINFRLKKG